MARLSWPGVQYLIETLKKPLRLPQAIKTLATMGNIQPSTARTYLATAQALRLIIAGSEGSFALAVSSDAPTLLSTSALVRLMKAAQQLMLQPNPKTCLEAAGRIGVHGSGAFWAAWHLARCSPYTAPMSPRPALVLALIQVRAEHLAPKDGSATWDAAEAFEVLSLLFTPAAPRHPESLDVTPPSQGREALTGAQFARACHILNARGLVEMVAVQHAFGAHATYRRFGGSLGYVKSLTLRAQRHHPPCQTRSTEEAPRFTLGVAG
jgi:hypothetical protein